MKQLGKMMLLALGFGLLAVVLSSIPNHPLAASGSAPVTVVNTPLPVQGTVSVNNFPLTQPVSGTVNVGNFPATQPVSGTVSVGNFPSAQTVTISGSVQVGNTSAQPVPVLDVNHPADQPLEKEICVAFGIQTCVTSPTSFTVPSTTNSGANVKRLVIESVSAGFCLVDSGTVDSIDLDVSGNSNVNGDNGTFARFPVVANSSIFNAETRIYADPGAQLSLFANTSIGSIGACRLVFNGYLATQ